jgi:hypothetical protein
MMPEERFCHPDENGLVSSKPYTPPRAWPDRITNALMALAVIALVLVQQRALNLSHANERAAGNKIVQLEIENFHLRMRLGVGQ